MTRYLVPFFLFAAVTTIAPRPAAADTVIAYDTVDAIEAISNRSIEVTGIIAGNSAPSTTRYTLASSTTPNEAGARCDRYALLAMSKPGKFQLVMTTLSGAFSTCKLVVRAP
jgi:hypothetical protein